MKVLLANGGPHPKGCTNRALEEVEKALKEEGIETLIYHIPNVLLQDCIACGSCAKTGKCVFDDCVNEFASMAKDADGFIFGTPVYYAHPTGKIQSFMDRVFYSAKSAFVHKPAAVISSSRRAGSVTSMDVLNKHLSISEMPIVTSNYWNEVHGHTPSDVEQDREGLDTMYALGKNMAWMLKCIEAGKKAGIEVPKIKRERQTLFVKMKTLYVSDLDGTLLNSQQQTSTYTNQTINKLVDQGMLFSYATARSYYSAKPATKGLSAKIPLILYNGAFIIDNQSQEILVSNFFLKEEVNDLAHYFNQKDFYPIVYAFINEQEKFSYIPSKSTKQQLDFISTRNDKRKNPVENNLFQGDVFYVSCIASKKQLESFYHDLKDRYQCLFSKDIYSQDWWLEILPKKATKAHAILQLKDYLKCEKVVVFGDGLNDLSMFEIADESYAVENACKELKEKATGVIGRHDQDAVARWLEENYKD